MAGEGKVDQPNDDLAVIKTTNQGIIAIQERTIRRMDSIQSILDALILKVDNQFEVMKAYFGRMNEVRDKGILEVHLLATMVPGIKQDLEHKETNIEVDLKHKETTHIGVSEQPNSKISKARSISSMSIIEDFGECMIEKIDDCHSNSTGIFQTKARLCKEHGFGCIESFG